MDVATQHALLERIADHRRAGRGTDVAASAEPALQHFHQSVEQLLG